MSFRRGFEKRAGLWTAGLAHLGQNALVKGLLNSKGYAKSLGSSFTEGFQGIRQSPGRAFMGGVLGGGVAPELNFLNQNARGFGEAAAKQLQARGIKELQPRDLVVARALSRGNFERAAKLSKRSRNPAVGDTLIDTANSFIDRLNLGQKTTSGKTTSGKIPPLSEIQKKVQDFGESARKNVRALEARWKDPSSPVTSNLAGGMFPRNAKRTGLFGGSRPKDWPAAVQVGTGASTSRPGWELAGSATGAAGLSLIDAPTAALNASKIGLTNPVARATLDKNPSVRNALQKTDEFFAKRPVRESFEAGKDGNTYRTKLESTLRSYGLNALTESAAQTAGNLGKSYGESLRTTRQFVPAPLREAARGAIQGAPRRPSVGVPVGPNKTRFEPVA